MIAAELPRSIYDLDALRKAAEAFEPFCKCRIDVDSTVRLELVPRPEVDQSDLARYFLNYALAASMAARMEIASW